MIERFEGIDGRRLLIATLQNQKICSGDLEIANALADRVQLVEFQPGELIIEQGAADNDLYLIISGAVSVLVKGKLVASRNVGDHIGDMSAIDPALPRSATILAQEITVAGKISEPTLSDIADTYGVIWRNLAKELSRRLYQRNALIPEPNKRPRIFIISSKEALDIAYEVKDILSRDDCDVVVWTDGIFFASSYAMEVLEEAVNISDFAIAIAQPDDTATVRGASHEVPRDNVIFELGLFWGRLGRRRAFLLQPSDRALKLPSDLTGITPVMYSEDPSVILTDRLASACHEVLRVVYELGVRR